MRPDFLKTTLESMDEPTKDDPTKEDVLKALPGLKIVGNERIRTLIVAPFGKNDEVIGVAWFDDEKKTWLITMGYSFVGEYKSWDTALRNWAVAYFG